MAGAGDASCFASVSHLFQGKSIRLVEWRLPSELGKGLREFCITILVCKHIVAFSFSIC